MAGMLGLILSHKLYFVILYAYGLAGLGVVRRQGCNEVRQKGFHKAGGSDLVLFDAHEESVSLSAGNIEVRTFARLGMFVGILVYLASTTSYLAKFVIGDPPLAVSMASYARPMMTAVFALAAFLLADWVKDSLIRMRWLLIIFLLLSITFPALDFI